MSDQDKPIRILLVEDNPGDVRLTEEHLKEADLVYELSVVRNGDDATAFLQKQGEFADAERPDLVLLDLNLPGKDGRTVLKEIREDETLADLPVVVLTGSRLEDDMVRAFDQNANFVHKPVEVQELKNVVGFPDEFWVTAQKPGD